MKDYIPEMTGHSVLYSKWNGFSGKMENIFTLVCGAQIYGLNYQECSGSRKAHRQFICMPSIWSPQNQKYFMTVNIHALLLLIKK